MSECQESAECRCGNRVDPDDYVLYAGVIFCSESCADEWYDETMKQYL